MPRRYNISWRTKDIATVANTVGKFNAKINRLLYQQPGLSVYLPEPINQTELMARIETRQDFNRIVNSLQRFLRPGAEEPITSASGIQTTRWMKHEQSLSVGIINRRRAQELKKLNISTEHGNMGSIQANSLQPKQFNFETMDPAYWNRFVANVENQVRANYFDEQNELYLSNYIKALYENHTLEHAKIIDQKLRQLPQDQLVTLMIDNPSLSINFHYDPYEEQIIFEEISNTLDYFIGIYNGAE